MMTLFSDGGQGTVYHDDLAQSVHSSRHYNHTTLSGDRFAICSLSA